MCQRNQTWVADVHGRAGTEAATEPDEREWLNRAVDREVRGHFPAGAVRQSAPLRPGDEPGIKAYAKALQHVLALADVPPPIMDEARDTLAAMPVS